jgi:hypothetical protein
VLIVNETITVTDSPVLLPAALLTVNENITVSDSPQLLESLIVVNDDTVITIDEPAIVSLGGDVIITDNDNLEIVSLVNLATVGGSVTITNNPNATVEIGNLASVGGDLTVEFQNQATVDVSGTLVAGNSDLTGDQTVSLTATTAAGSTEATLLNAEASMQAFLPTGAFESPVTFTVEHLVPATLPTEQGLNFNNAAVTVDPVAAYQFTFAVPTLNQNATLTFTVNVGALDGASQAVFLAALASNSVTLAVKNDAPGSVYQTFAVCASGQTPAADGCVTVERLDADGNPLPTGSLVAPSFVRFEGVAGSFSTWAVAIVKPIFPFAGFFRPVDNLPVLNSVKAGQAVPVKFSLGGNRGLAIFATGYPASAQIACDSTAPADAVEETVTAGGSSLSYDPTTDQYTYVWKTAKAWANTCRQFILKLTDGTFHRANFVFKK